MYQRRDPAVIIILSIVTCGLYPLYWYWRTSADIQSAHGAPDTDPLLEVALILVTCGIYVVYWWYKYGRKVAEIRRLRGLPARDNAILYTVLSALGAFVGWMDLVNMTIMQGELNELWSGSPNTYA